MKNKATVSAIEHARTAVQRAAMRALAKSIARDLMTAHCGQRRGEVTAVAAKLVTATGEELGGWCLESMALRIEKHLCGEIGQ